MTHTPYGLLITVGLLAMGCSAPEPKPPAAAAVAPTPATPTMAAPTVAPPPASATAPTAATTEAAAQPARAAAEKAMQSRPALEARSGSYELGRLRAAHVLYYEDGKLRLAEEHVSLEPYGERRRLYLLEGDRLVYAREEEEGQRLLELTFDAAGTLIFGERRANGQTASLLGHEPELARRRLAALRAAGEGAGGAAWHHDAEGLFEGCVRAGDKSITLRATNESIPLLGSENIIAQLIEQVRATGADRAAVAVLARPVQAGGGPALELTETVMARRPAAGDCQ